MRTKNKDFHDEDVLLESKNPGQPPKMLKKSRLHDSVFEANVGHDETNVDPFLKAVFSWIAPEYIQHPKTLKWWIRAAVVFGIVLLLEALSGSWSMILATVVFGVVYWYAHEHQPPKHTKIVISDAGIKIGHSKISFGEMDKFWLLVEEPFMKRLVIRTKRNIFPDLLIELEEEDPTQVAAFLRKHLPEVKDKKVHAGDILLHLLKL